MMSISSKAGKRLAKAKVAMDAHDTSIPSKEMSNEEHQALGEDTWEWIQAAHAVADELIVQGFHEMEGD